MDDDLRSQLQHSAVAKLFHEPPLAERPEGSCSGVDDARGIAGILSNISESGRATMALRPGPGSQCTRRVGARAGASDMTVGGK